MRETRVLTPGCFLACSAAFRNIIAEAENMEEM